MSYGLHIAVVSYALYVLRQIAIVEPSSPGWISLRLLTWSAAALSGTAAVITWLHASGLQNALDRAGVAGDRLCGDGICGSDGGVSVARVRAGRRATASSGDGRDSVHDRDDRIDRRSALAARRPRPTASADLAARSSIDPEPVSGPASCCSVSMAPRST